MSGTSSVKRGTSSIKSPKSPRSPRIKIGSSIVSDNEIEDIKSTAESAISKKDICLTNPEYIPGQTKPDRYQISLENTPAGQAPPYILDEDSFQPEAPPARLEIHLEYKEGCEHALEFIRMIEEQFPNARFEKEVSQEDVFEYHLNEKVVYSKRLLKRWPGQKGKKGGPDFEEIIEITYWMEQGRSFMHMYLCSFVERRGNEDIHLAINLKRNTPLAKRIILSCTIS